MSESSEGRYFQILDTAPDAMVVVGRDGRVAFVNVQTEKLFGYPRAELLGKPLDVLIPERFRPAHGAHIERYFSHPGTRPMGSGLQLFGRRSDGSEVPIEVSLSPVEMPDGVLVSAAIRDIGERKRMEAAAKLSADRLASSVDSIQGAFGLFDADGRLALCNSVYRRLLGETLSGRFVGRSYEEVARATSELSNFSSAEERESFVRDRLAERLDPGDPVDVRTRDGRSLRITNRSTPEGGIVQTIWDLTDDMQRAEELRQARAAAEAGSAAKSEFLSSMSHELRTPLNAILGFAQLLQRDRKEPLSQRQKDRVQEILKGGEHLLRLIDDILDLSRIEAGGVSISTEPVSIADVLEEVTRTLGPMAAKDEIELVVESLPDDLPMIAADRTRFVQILMNFGSNAIKYNRRGGMVTFSLSAPVADMLRVTVRDTGIGIPTDKHDLLFQPFQRVGQEAGPIEGTGIGLVITRRLAELMHGRVGFESAAGEGSQFWIEIPVHASRIRSVKPSAPAPTVAALSAGGGSKRLLLYVEDNPANVAFMKDLLSTFDGIELVTASTAELGVVIARERRPDVVILDINLPGMSGLDALRTLKTWPETREIPVIALSAAASERDKQRGEQAGFFRYVTKPVQVDELLSALELLLTKPALS